MISRRIAMSLAVILNLLPLFYAGAQPKLAPAGSEPPARPAPQATAQGAVYRADLKAGKLLAAAVEPAPRAVEIDLSSLPKKPPLEPVPSSRKLHPRLTEWLGKREASESVRVVITFEDHVQIPRFPSLDPNFRRESAENRQALAAAESLVEKLKEKRAPVYAQRRQELAEQYGAEVIETFWLIDAVVAQMPLRRVLALAQRDNVLSIVPVDSGEPPPQDGDPRNNVDRGRARIVSDPYFNLGLNGGFIGLLDTGLRFTHRQLTAPSMIGFHLDCVNGGSDCLAAAGSNPNDDCWNHGTASAAILTGNDRAGVSFRGVTGTTVDSIKVYPSTFDTEGYCIGGLDAAAAVRGFQVAVTLLDQVIVAEIQGGGGERGPIALAANAAFDAGAVVVAANGNSGEAGTVAEPANASRALGVGNFDVITGGAISNQSRGPTADGRFKPDFQAPTNTETASNGCNFGRDCRTGGSDTAFQIFGGTSGATPYAGGATALMRNFVSRAMGTTAVDPGLVYGLMILSGQEAVYDNIRGTGPLRLPTDGTLRWGVAYVNHKQTLEIPIDFRSPQALLDAAIWWPESPGSHSDVDLMIVDPVGVVRYESLFVQGVFERARFQGSILGIWRIRIHGFSVNSTPQRVYYAILNRPTPP